MQYYRNAILLQCKIITIQYYCNAILLQCNITVMQYYYNMILLLNIFMFIFICLLASEKLFLIYGCFGVKTY